MNKGTKKAFPISLGGQGKTAKNTVITVFVYLLF